MRAATILGMSPDLYHGITSRSIASSLTGLTVNNDTAMKVSAYKRGVELIANYCGKTPFHVKANKKKDKKHPAWKLVRKWAQHHQLSAFEFRRTLILLALTRGNGYGYIVRDETYRPIALRILDSGRVTPTLRGGKLYYKFDGRERLIPSTDIIHIKGITKDGYVGLDPIRTYAADVLGLSLAQLQYASTYYAAGGSPSVYVYSPVSLDDDKYNRLKGATGPLKRSLDNPHEIPVLDNAELRTLNLSAEQTQLLGSREFSLKDIANILNLTVHKLNGEGTGGYKSVEEENNAFRDDTLDPWFCQFEIEYEKLLTEEEQESESHQVEAVRESLTRSNMTDRANYLTKAIGGPWMTAAEGRDVDSLEELDDTDELYPPPNMTKEDPTAATEPANDPTPIKPKPAKPKRSDTLKQVAAIEDVLQRMAKRLNAAARKAGERPASFEAFVEQIESKNGDVIRSALNPVIELCGGSAADTETLAAEFVDEHRDRLQSIGPQTRGNSVWLANEVEDSCDCLALSVGRFARKAVELWT